MYELYTKQNEIIKRNEKLKHISFHILKRGIRDYFKKKLIKNSDIIISTNENSYCDELINWNFPFVIIVLLIIRMKMKY